MTPEEAYRILREDERRVADSRRLLERIVAAEVDRGVEPRQIAEQLGLTETSIQKMVASQRVAREA